MTSSILVRRAALDRALVAKTWPADSSWWVSTITRFVTSGRRQLVVRVGRRGGKSSTLARFAVAFALAYDCTQIPPGDVGVVAFISTTRDEASQRLRTIKAILDALAVAWRPIEGGIELADRAIVFKVFAASIAGVSGFTSILVICDEVAKWRDADTGSNPATEVLASVRPTMATQPDARIILSSSPLALEDAHAKAFALGDTDHQVTAFAESWIANPTLSEEALHRDEPDLKIFSREYAAIPSAAVSAAFEREHVLWSFQPVTGLGRRHEPFGIIDVSSGKSDGYGYATAQWCDTGPAIADRKLVFTFLGLIEGRFWQHESSGDAVVTKIAFELRARGVRRVFGDQRESLMTSAAFARNGLRFHEVVWTAPRKEQAVAGARRWFADGTICFAPPHGDVHTKMRDQLLGFEERISASGAFTYGARGRRHDDLAALVITAAMSDTPKVLGANAWPGQDGSPVNPGNKMLAALTSLTVRENAPRRSFNIQDAYPSASADPSILTDPEFQKLKRYLP